MIKCTCVVLVCHNQLDWGVKKRVDKCIPIMTKAIVQLVKCGCQNNRYSNKRLHCRKIRLKVLLRRKFLFLFPRFFNINLLYMFKIIQIAKNWNDTCVRGLEISHWKVRKYHPPLQSSQSNSARDLRKAVVRLTTWFMHCDVETSTKRFAFGKSLWV